MVTEIKRLPDGCKSWEAGEVKFIVHESLCEDAYVVLEDLRLEMRMGSTPTDFFNAVVVGYSALNEGRYADGPSLIYNAIHGAERGRAGMPPAWLEALTLFVRPEGSDLTKWDQSQAFEWVKLWNEEGIAIPDLFRVANGCSDAFMNDFLPRTQLFLGDKVESEKESEPLANR